MQELYTMSEVTHKLSVKAFTDQILLQISNVDVHIFCLATTMRSG